MVRPFRWDSGRRVLHLLDQRRLPTEEVWIECATALAVADSIREMAIRGAPAIGIASAYAVVLGFARDSVVDSPADRFDALAAALLDTRPTAVNLSAALERMRVRFESLIAAPPAELLDGLEDEADRIAAEDLEANRRLGALGADLLSRGERPARILTHCNAGSLATSGYGTALGIVRALAESGRRVEVFAPETRPYLQGARLTAWELMADGIPVTLVTDGMVGSLLAAGGVDAVVVGADRVAANGDIANKIGTYQAAVLAREHAVPFLVAVPFSSVDLGTPNGAAIPIEERRPEEVVEIGGTRIAPEGVPVWNPAFDVTPARYITAIVTERGVARPPFGASLARLAATGC
jgi:methylthioribose-1-phosphate isomerase